MAAALVRRIMSNSKSKGFCLVTSQVANGDAAQASGVANRRLLWLRRAVEVGAAAPRFG